MYVLKHVCALHGISSMYIRRVVAEENVPTSFIYELPDCLYLPVATGTGYVSLSL